MHFPNGARIVIAAVGNPGVGKIPESVLPYLADAYPFLGKSTCLNAYVGEHKFESGMRRRLARTQVSFFSCSTIFVFWVTTSLFVFVLTEFAAWRLLFDKFPFFCLPPVRPKRWYVLPSHSCSANILPSRAVPFLRRPRIDERNEARATLELE